MNHYFSKYVLTLLDLDFSRTNWRFLQDGSSNGSTWQRHRRSRLNWRSRKCIGSIHAWNKESCYLHEVKRINQCWCLQCESLSLRRIIINIKSWTQCDYCKLPSRIIQALGHRNKRRTAEIFIFLEEQFSLAIYWFTWNAKIRNCTWKNWICTNN